MNIRVYYEDTDAGGIVYHANYLKFCERARSELFFNSNIHPFYNDCNFVVSHMDAKFIKPSHLGDMLDIKTSVLQIKGASVLLKQQIYRISSLKEKHLNEMVFDAKFIVACLSDLKPRRLSSELIDFFKTMQS